MSYSPDIQGRLINRIISYAASYNTIDKFPVPDRHNRTYNYEERRDQILEAIELSHLSEEKKDGFRGAVAKDFRGMLK